MLEELLRVIRLFRMHKQKSKWLLTLPVPVLGFPEADIMEVKRFHAGRTNGCRYLCNHPSHRDTDQVGRINLQIVQQLNQIQSHVL